MVIHTGVVDLTTAENLGKRVLYVAARVSVQVVVESGRSVVRALGSDHIVCGLLFPSGFYRQ